jgi:hypothetical protein
MNCYDTVKGHDQTRTLDTISRAEEVESLGDPTAERYDLAVETGTPIDWSMNAKKLV